MLFLLIDNTDDLESAKMTPKIIDYFKKKKINLLTLKNKDISLFPKDITGIILSGGPILLSDQSLLEKYILNFNVLICYPDIPILGICFGFQVISMAYGSIIQKLNVKKLGIHENICIEKDSMLFQKLNKKIINVYQNHNDFIGKCPINFTITSIDDNKIIQSIESIEKLRFGTQFHPENSKDGDIIIDNFINFCLLRS